MAIQPKLLKVVEEKRFRRVGSVQDRSVDVHLITASNRDLRAMVAQGRFRDDLYFRVSCLPLHLPPLRERREDIPLLAEFFIARLRDDLGKAALALSSDAAAALRSYDWPGNIRELRNVLERAALLSENGHISAPNLAFAVLPARGSKSGSPTPDLMLEEVERQHILKVLNHENGSVERAAVRLGIPRSTLYAKLKRHGFKGERARHSYLPTAEPE
jgi:DNA-binding NtrC family response regulator